MANSFKRAAAILKAVWNAVKDVSPVLAPVFVVLLILNLRNVDIGFLQLYSIDEYVFHGSLRHMFSGLATGDVPNLFGYGFYQYGFVYFFLNLLAALPGLLSGNTWLAILAPRIVTSLFALGSLVWVYKFASLYMSRRLSLLLALIYTTMPAFWFNATWFHPDWAMSFFLLGFAYFLARDKWEFGQRFWIAVALYSLAVAFKYQAITFLPVLGLYVFYDNIHFIELAALKTRIFRFLAALAVVGAVFVLCNPYVIHPIGWKAFIGSFIGNMASNETNHGSAEAVTISDKVVHAVGDYYLNPVFFGLLVGIALLLAYEFARRKERDIFSVLAISFLVNLLYLLFFVNKAWQMYYLPVFSIGLLLAIHILSRASGHTKVIILCSILFVQVLYYAPSYHPVLATSRDAHNPDWNDYTHKENLEMNDFIVASLEGKVSDDTHVLVTAYTPFEYESIGLTYEQVRTIFGALAEDSIDRDAYVRAQKAYWGDTKSEKEIAESFKPIDYIIVRKNSPFIDTVRIELVGDEDGYLRAADIVQKLYSGEFRGYTMFAESDYVVIFKVMR